MKIISVPKTILVFKTSVRSQAGVLHLKPLLDAIMHDDEKWNFDLEDCDHILRVETRSCDAACIIELLGHEGYNCSELEDLILVKPETPLKTVRPWFFTLMQEQVLHKVSGD